MNAPLPPPGIGRRVALVHDYLTQAGGAERVVAALHRLFPAAPVYTSLYAPAATLPDFAGADVRTSPLQRWPFTARGGHRLALPFLQAAFEGFDLDAYDVVISSASGFAKAVLTGTRACHICYCHSPARYAWNPQAYLGPRRRALLGPALRRLRAADRESAQRPDFLIANSRNTAHQVRKFYGREADAVIYPPVQTGRFHPAAPAEVGEHFLVVSRLVAPKRIDLAVEACGRLRRPLRVVGAGPEMARLRRMAGPTVRFLGAATDAAVAAEYARCRALIVPGEEDFGITPLECMAGGRPVVAYGAGGALETVRDGQTGILFAEQTPEALARALVRSERQAWVPSVLQAHAQRFDEAVFEAGLLAFVDKALAAYDLRTARPGSK